MVFTREILGFRVPIEVVRSQLRGFAWDVIYHGWSEAALLEFRYYYNLTDITGHARIEPESEENESKYGSEFNCTLIGIDRTTPSEALDFVEIVREAWLFSIIAPFGRRPLDHEGLDRWLGQIREWMFYNGPAARPCLDSPCDHNNSMTSLESEYYHRLESLTLDNMHR